MCRLSRAPAYTPCLGTQQPATWWHHVLSGMKHTCTPMKFLGTSGVLRDHRALRSARGENMSHHLVHFCLVMSQHGVCTVLSPLFSTLVAFAVGTFGDRGSSHTISSRAHLPPCIVSKCLCLLGTTILILRNNKRHACVFMYNNVSANVSGATSEQDWSIQKVFLNSHDFNSYHHIT